MPHLWDLRILGLRTKFQKRNPTCSTPETFKLWVFVTWNFRKGIAPTPTDVRIFGLGSKFQHPTPAKMHHHKGTLNPRPGVCSLNLDDYWSSYVGLKIGIYALMGYRFST